MLDLWSGMINATGGALIPEKKIWCAIDFKWTNREWKFMPHDELDAIQTIHDPSGNIHEVEHLSHHDAY